MTENQKVNELTPATAASSTSAAPVPEFRLYKLKVAVPISYVVPLNTTDDQLKSLLWFLRRKVRMGAFHETGIVKPISRQYGKLGYASGMLSVYRGEKCVDELYVSDAQLNRGDLGPCGYGEHDDAYYQWGIEGDSGKDSGGIRQADGNVVTIFDYPDNWTPTRNEPK